MNSVPTRRWRLLGRFMRGAQACTADTVSIDATELADLRGQLTAIRKSLGVIELSLDGTVLDANENFLRTLGYTLDEIRGQHHRMFVEPAMRDSPRYRDFWAKLGRGEYDAGQYKRIGKHGREVWIQASYNPILSSDGRILKIVKYATDITADTLRHADMEGQIAAINKAQAVIEFSMDGTILGANDNFLNALGYTLEEIRGKHHSLFVPPDERLSEHYRAFWAKLGRGEYDAGQYRRIGKNGREVWIQASYNPIFDMNGRAIKVVKYASDTTAQVKAAEELRQAVEQSQKVVAAAGGGNLSQRIATETMNGQVKMLCEGINSLVDTMAEVIGQIRSSTTTINQAAGEIAAGNHDLSSRTEAQAGSLEQTASTMDELTRTVMANADNARDADRLAQGASEVAARGGMVIAEVVHTMSAINESSRKVADIIGVIDGIAFQTNILALNAAVEAARAGTQGRGFAVVATEVRSLAQRSATAAKEIKSLIGDALSRTEAGTRQVDSAGKTMADIVESVQRVTGIMGQIAQASREQSTGIAQVNQAVSHMDTMTQQNAALVEQAAAAADLMRTQSHALKELVDAFSVTAAPERAPDRRRA